MTRKNGRLRRICGMWARLSEVQCQAFYNLLVTIETLGGEPGIEGIYGILALLADESPKNAAVQPGG